MNRILFIVFICIAVLLNSQAVHSQNNGIKLSHLGAKQGLAQGTVYKAFQDDKGFVWAITDNSVDVFDGYRFQSFSTPSYDLTNTYIIDAIQDQQGDFWFALSDRGVLRFDAINNQVTHVLAPVADEKFGLVGLTPGINQDILLLTSENLLSIDLKTNQITELVSFDFGDIILSSHLYQNYYFISTLNGVYVADLKALTLTKMPLVNSFKGNKASINVEANKAYSMTVVDGVLYTGTNSGLYGLDITNIDIAIRHDQWPDYQQMDEEVSIWQLLPSGENLYLATETGLYKYHRPSKQFSFVLSLQELTAEVSDKRIIALFEDHVGRIWLSSSSQGLYIWNPSKKQVDNITYQKNSLNGLKHHDVWSIAQSPTNLDEVWVATSFGIVKKNRKTGQFSHYLSDLADEYQYGENYIFEMAFINDTDLLITTANNAYILHTFDGSVSYLSDFPELYQYFKKDYYDLFFDDGYVWLAFDTGLIRIDIENKTFEHFQLHDKYSTNAPHWNILGTYKNEHTLLLSVEKSLFSYDYATDKLEKLYSNPELSGRIWHPFTQMHLDNQHRLWLATQGRGIYVISATDYRLLFKINNQSHDIDNNVYGLLADPQNELWFSSHNGVYAINLDSLFIRHFDQRDGLVGKEYNAGATAVFDDGSFAFGSTAGVSIFHPEKLKRVQKETKSFDLQISNFEMLSNAIDLPLHMENNYRLQLGYDDVGIRIDFTNFDFLNSGEQKFLYEIQGAENIKIPPTYDNFVVFPRLPSGEQTLKVSVVSPTTGVISQPFYLHFDVAYPPWKSPLAYGVYLLVTLTIIGSITRRRIKQRNALLEAHEEVKYRENRLQLALKGSNSDVWDWQAKNNMLFSKRINMELGYKYAESAYLFSQHLDLIHPQDKKEFITAWNQFITLANLDENFACTYRLKAENGEWLWFRDLGKIVALDAHGKPLRVTGSYTNITETRAEEERAQHYGAAFAQTKDWVVIISHDVTKITANQAIRDVFGWQEENLPLSVLLKALPKEKKQSYINVLKGLDIGDSWRGDELIKVDNGTEYHVLVNITVGRSQLDEQQHIVCTFTDITAQKSAEKELRYLANYDHLTGLPNRSLLLERIEHAMMVAQSHHTKIALLFIDLDKFKQVNDSLGHDYGDLLLKVVTARLQNALRTEDTIARLGGDEFVVLIESFSGMEDVAHIAQGLIDSLAQPVTLVEHMVSIGASIGIAVYPDNVGNSDEVLRSADIAMYHAKQNGRNNFQFFNAEMNEQVAERVRQETLLKLAVQERQLVNYYQPIIDAKSQQTVGVELLLRWPSAEGMVSPVHFIPMAEDLGLIVDITYHALDVALSDIKQWRAWLPELYLSLNVSANHFTDSGLIEQVSHILAKHKLPSSALKIEVTESALIKEPEKATQTMLMLSELGIELALDDFGTGYSSLAYLKQLPLDILKIDRSFISGIGSDKTDQAIVDATLVLARSLNMKCIAEGVEEQEQLDYLVEHNCQFIQGYFFSKPQPSHKMTHFLKKSQVVQVN